MSPQIRPVLSRARWSAIGAAVAVILGAGGLGLAQASVGTGERPVTVTITPTRVLDTRIGLGLEGAFADAAPRSLKVTGSIPVAPSGKATVVPAGASAILVNVTVVRPTHAGFLALRPGGASGSPTTSTVNFAAGTIQPNAATVDIGPAGTVQIWVETASDSGAAHVLLDIVGYTVDHQHDDRYYTRSQSDDRYYTRSQSDDRYYTQAEVDALVDGLLAQRSFAVSAFSSDHVALSAGEHVIASVEITAPVDGQVTVFSTAYPTVEPPAAVSCFVRAGAEITTPQWFEPGTGENDGNLAGAGTFDLAAGATQAYDYVCWSPNGTGSITYPSGLTAMFTPAR